jgi:large subunit ribosomal protein L4
MAQISLYSMEGSTVGTLDVSDAVFAAPLRRDLLHQAVLRHLANQRAGTADTKGRGEVSGGGRKPWRQKGTGRARHGSTRSPIWRKGGVVFGPHPRSYQQAMPRKMRRLELCSALSSRVSGNQLIALDELTLTQFKTREFVKVLQALQITDSVLLQEKTSQQMISKLHKTRVATHKALVVIGERDGYVEGSAANVPDVKVCTIEQINVYDVLKYRRVVMTRDAIRSLEARLSKTQEESGE